VRQRAFDETRQAFAQLRSQSALTDEVADGNLLTARHGLLDRIVLRRALGRDRHADPVRERTEIILRGGTVL